MENDIRVMTDGAKSRADHIQLQTHAEQRSKTLIQISMGETFQPVWIVSTDVYYRCVRTSQKEEFHVRYSRRRSTVKNTVSNRQEIVRHCV
jgi:hypothetical protein